MDSVSYSEGRQMRVVESVLKGKDIFCMCVTLVNTRANVVSRAIF